MLFHIGNINIKRYGLKSCKPSSAFGWETGFLVRAVTMLTSNVLFSQGPWTPWQMFAMGIIGFLAEPMLEKMDRIKVKYGLVE